MGRRVGADSGRDGPCRGRERAVGRRRAGAGAGRCSAVVWPTEWAGSGASTGGWSATGRGRGRALLGGGVPDGTGRVAASTGGWSATGRGRALLGGGVPDGTGRFLSTLFRRFGWWREGWTGVVRSGLVFAHASGLGGRGMAKCGQFRRRGAMPAGGVAGWGRHGAGVGAVANGPGRRRGVAASRGLRRAGWRQAAGAMDQVPENDTRCDAEAQPGSRAGCGGVRRVGQARLRG